MKRTMMKKKGIGAVLQKGLAIVLLGLFLSLGLVSCKGNSQAKESEGTKAEESTSVKAEEKADESTVATEESTSAGSEELIYDSGAVNKSNIFASYPGDAMWKSTANEYMLIPYIKDGKELIEFRLYGEAKFLLEGLSFSKTEQNGLKVSGKMRNLKDNSWNGDADVTWNSLETIDYPIVTLTNGTEFTDVDMSGDYSYAGMVNGAGQSNAGTATNASEYIFPYANERLIARGEYESLDAATLRLAINEIYARHGRQYDTQDLNAYFSSKSWYRPQYSKSEFDKIESQVLNSYERENVKILTGYRDSLLGKVGDIRGVYEVKWGEGGAQMTISGQPDAYVVDINANYVVDASKGNAYAVEFEGTAIKEGGSLYKATGEDGWVSFVVLLLRIRVLSLEKSALWIPTEK